jgi:hypothetical protein
MPRKHRPTDREIAERIARRLQAEAKRAEQAREHDIQRALLAYAAMGCVFVEGQHTLH